MKYINALISGIGTASGVSWPSYSFALASFAALLALVGFAMTGPLGIGLAVAGALIFAVIAAPVAYWSYQSSLAAEEKLITELAAEQLDRAQQIELFLTFLDKPGVKEKITEQSKKSKNTPNGYVNNNLACFKEITDKFNDPELNWQEQRRLYKKEIGNQSLLIGTKRTKEENEKLLEYINELKKELLKYINEISKPVLEENFLTKFTTPRALVFKTGFMSFGSTYGTIAGTSAGLLGVLSSVGIIGGIMTMPILAGIVLILATVISVTVAYCAVEKAKLQYYREELTKHVKFQNTLLKGCNFDLDVNKKSSSKKHLGLSNLSSSTVPQTDDEIDNITSSLSMGDLPLRKSKISFSEQNAIDNHKTSKRRCSQNQKQNNIESSSQSDSNVIVLSSNVHAFNHNRNPRQLRESKKFSSEENAVNDHKILKRRCSQNQNDQRQNNIKASSQSDSNVEVLSRNIYEFNRDQNFQQSNSQAVEKTDLNQQKKQQ